MSQRRRVDEKEKMNQVVGALAMTICTRDQHSFIQESRGCRVSLALFFALGLFCSACSSNSYQERLGPQNALHQHTGEAGSTIPKARPPYYPNTAGNIVAPPGNPAGNPPGSPPLVGGNMAQQGVWP
jgi:hypothetical protein